MHTFRTFVPTGIVLQVRATPTIDPALAVGSVEEPVSVEASVPLVDVSPGAAGAAGGGSWSRR
ncbi:MAG: hypothetical protein HOP16_01495 [Acidobacteria bacterium]|nr:hypothetical protein [Acidobacteriota bacterium]